MTTLTEHLSGTQQRDFTLREVTTDADAWEFTGIGVPYGETIDLGWFRERFEPGAVDSSASLVCWCHDSRSIIGRITAGQDTDEGHEITAHLSDTTAGRDAYTLLRDGVVDKLSIGFDPLEYRIETDEETGIETVIHTKVRAREFSLVPWPAYDTAAVSDVRRQDHHSRKDTPVETLTRSQLNEALNPLTEDLDALKRSVAMVETQTERTSHPADQFRSLGEYVAAAARGDERALALHESFSRAAAPGATSADVPEPKAGENFLGTTIRFVEERRKFANLFTHAPLPAKGMTVEYAQFDSGTFLVGKQAAELTDLPGPSQLVFKDASAPVETYGGWSRLSRQAIERAAVPYLDTLYRGMAIKYAQETNAAVAKTVLAKVDTQLAGTAGTDFLKIAGNTVADWAGAIVDASDLYEDRGFEATGLAVSSDVFKALATQVAADGRPLLDISGNPTTNTAGTANLTKADGSLLRLDVKKVSGIGKNRAFFWDPVAVEVRESAGAPVLLQDDNIINLSREFSLYGYLAITIPFPTAIVPVKIGS